jgi:hypothetical protein
LKAGSKERVARLMVGAVGLLWVCLSAPAAPSGEPALSQDDVTLLLIGGASPQKMVALIEQRGINFSMSAELERKFRAEGADARVIEALNRASQKRGSLARPASPASPAVSPASAESRSAPAPGNQPLTSTEQKIHDSLSGLAGQPAGKGERKEANSSSPSGSAASQTRPKESQAPDLSDPSPERIQQIIQAFAAKEELFKRARDMYTYHQINKVEELDADNNVTGQYEQDWDVLYDDNGHRIERVTYAPSDTLKRLIVTEQDLDSMRNIQPFVLTTEDLPEYDIKYLGHVKVDYLTTYVFSIRPKEIKKGKEYFQGVVWVDDQDLQIVKSEGKTVPEIKSKHGQFNLFPRFTTWRQQIDGKFWFPTFTMADDTLYFPSGPVHVREIIRYTDYKQFRSSVKTKVVVALPNGQTQEVGKPEPDGNSPKH